MAITLSKFISAKHKSARGIAIQMLHTLGPRDRVTSQHTRVSARSGEYLMRSDTVTSGHGTWTQTEGLQRLDMPSASGQVTMPGAWTCSLHTSHPAGLHHVGTHPRTGTRLNQY